MAHIHTLEPTLVAGNFFPQTDKAFIQQRLYIYYITHGDTSSPHHLRPHAYRISIVQITSQIGPSRLSDWLSRIIETRKSLFPLLCAFLDHVTANRTAQCMARSDSFIKGMHPFFGPRATITLQINRCPVNHKWRKF